MAGEAERAVDAAIEDGRIARVDRDRFLRAFVSAPDLTAKNLAARSADRWQAIRNRCELDRLETQAAWDEDAHREYGADASVRLGIRPEELI